MAAGLLAVAAAAVTLAAAALPVLADKDCFETCFKHCVANDKSMTDYCNYACGMTCGPNGALRRPLAGAAIAGLPINCQLACVRESCRRLQADDKDMEACYGQCYHGCKTKAGRPRPLGAGTVWSGGVARPPLPQDAGRSPANVGAGP
ncbi:hypothetical protein GQ55_5G259500 [Panicum hallii var. hallii]|uniref:Acidic protein n=1 Tax=Panicum hallii var. hallii TaxID=1504633 RepID=A0A2T7DK88_9POAL|nr:hypothetical protein GQ55_5G259500 [Panicum hallii var. hallii]